MKKTIKIPMATGPAWPVECEVVGDLGVHEVQNDRKRFSVTHLPTLLGLTSVVPPEIMDDRKKVTAWAARVQEGLKKDWLAMRKYDHAKATAGSETLKIRERLRAHCMTIRGGK